MAMQLCDRCSRLTAQENLQEEESLPMLLQCRACRGLEVYVAAPQYYNAADLAEDFGVFDPEAEGYVYTQWGWTTGKLVSELVLDEEGGDYNQVLTVRRTIEGVTLNGGPIQYDDV